MKINKIILSTISILILFIISDCLLFSQNQQPAPPAATPLELPNLFIVGDASLNVSSGIKQFPGNPRVLTKNELDSLNPLEKQQSLLLPVEPLPDNISVRKFNKGYFKGEFGRYSTPMLEGGYGFDINGYKFFANAGFETSNGHIDNSNYSKFFVKGYSDFIAPDKYYIFGGSKTKTSININNEKYKLYAMTSTPERNLFNLNLNIETEGNFEGYNFNLGGAINTLKLSQTNHDASDNNINGFIAIKNTMNKYGFGGKLLLDFHSLRGEGVNFMQGNVFGTYNYNDLSVNLNAGLQTANNSKGINRSGLLLSGDAEYRLNKLFTLKGLLSTGLENLTFMDLIGENSYLSDSAEVDFVYNTPALSGFLYYHPSEDIGLSFGLKYRMFERMHIFTPSDTGSFLNDYVEGSLGEFLVEGFWQLNQTDNIVVNFTTIFTSIKNGKSLPYYSPINLSITYKKGWFENFGTHFGVSYVGNRYIDIFNLKEITGYFILNINADYQLKKDLALYARLDNVLNSNIYVWDGYKERNLYAGIGILWQF